MKTVFTALCLSIAFVAFAQDENKMVEAMMTAPGMDIKSSTMKVQKEHRPTLNMHLNGDAGDIEKGWKKHLSEQCNCDLKKEKGILQSLGVSIPAVSVETVSLFTKIEEDETGAQISVTVDFGGKFLSEKDTPAEADKMKTLMRGYAKGFYGDQYAEVISGQQKAYDKLAKEHEKLVKEGEKLRKNIESENNAVTKAESNTAKAEQEIKDLEAKIAELKAAAEKSKLEIGRLEKAAEKNGALAAAKLEQSNAQKAKVQALQQQADSIQNK